MDPHPVTVKVIIGENRDYIRVLLYSDYTTIIGWGGISLRKQIWKPSTGLHRLLACSKTGFRGVPCLFGL